MTRCASDRKSKNMQKEREPFDINGPVRALAGKVHWLAASIALVILAGGISAGIAMTITKDVWVRLRQISMDVEGVQIAHRKCEEEHKATKEQLSELKSRLGIAGNP